MSDVTVLIPTIANRADKLQRAIRSVENQTYPCELVVVEDEHHDGSAATRNRGLRKVETEWVAFLDDDDAFMPEHIETCMDAQRETGADLVYPWYRVIGGSDPRANAFGKPFDPDRLRRESYIFIGCLARASMAKQAGFSVVGGQSGPAEGADTGFYRGMLDLGATFHHVAKRTYRWHHWGRGKPGRPGNTSGRGWNW